jgi:hypothetical protein
MIVKLVPRVGPHARDARRLVRFHLDTRDSDPVFVYSRGKVGSSTLTRTIIASTSRPTLHVHRMTRPSGT